MQGLIESLEPRRLLSGATNVIAPFIPLDPATGQMIAQPKMDASALVEAGWKLLENENGDRWWVRGYPPDEVMIERGYEKIIWNGQEQWTQRGAWSIEFRFDAGGPFPPDDLDLQPGDVWLPPVPPNYHEMVAGLGLELEVQAPFASEYEPRFGERTVTVRVILSEGVSIDQLHQAVAGLPDVVQVWPDAGYIFLTDIIEDSRVHHDVDVIPYDRKFAGRIPVQMWDPLKGASAVAAADPVMPAEPVGSMSRRPPVFSDRVPIQDRPGVDLFEEEGDSLLAGVRPRLQSL